MQRPVCLSPFPFLPPADDPEEWLVRYDRNPRLVAHWPDSERLTLVAVYVLFFMTPDETDSEAFVITHPDQANDLLEQVRRKPDISVLFFTVPRQLVMPYSVGLTDDSWWKPPT